MLRYAAFLRGINVGGNKIIKMEDLKQMCALPGLTNLRTFIASGNLIFESKEKNAGLLEKKIEKQLQKSLGYEVKTFVRTFEELAQILRQNPFASKAGKDASIFVSFLTERPHQEKQSAIASKSTPDEIFAVHNRELYSWVRRGAGKLLFSNQFIEKNLGVSATTRNCNTVNKITAL